MDGWSTVLTSLPTYNTKAQGLPLTCTHSVSTSSVHAHVSTHTDTRSHAPQVINTHGEHNQGRDAVSQSSTHTWVSRILEQRLVLPEVQNLHSRHSGMYSGMTWSPTLTEVTPSPMDSTTPPPSWPRMQGNWVRGAGRAQARSAKARQCTHTLGTPRAHAPAPHLC
jgi:hypothetical protein